MLMFKPISADTICAGSDVRCLRMPTYLQACTLLEKKGSYLLMHGVSKVKSHRNRSAERLFLDVRLKASHDKQEMC